MKPGFFIDRPVFSTVLSILIVIVGIIGLALLPVDQYPQITPPVVKISATYPGASASLSELDLRKSGVTFPNSSPEVSNREFRLRERLRATRR